MKLSRILCVAGIHDWTQWRRAKVHKAVDMNVQRRRCKRCGKVAERNSLARPRRLLNTVPARDVEQAELRG